MANPHNAHGASNALEDTDGVGVVVEMPTGHPAARPSAAASVWIVTIIYPREEPDLAAVFGDRDDALRYATWWNREETRRYGAGSKVEAIAEEADYYAIGVWQPPQPPTGQPHAAPTTAYGQSAPTVTALSGTRPPTGSVG